jgi:hypothetical protein
MSWRMGETQPSTQCKRKDVWNIWNDEMIGWIKSYALEFELIQDFAHVWWELEDMLKMMLKNECSC